MLSSHERAQLWNNHFTPKTASVMKGKKLGHSTALLRTLAILGSSTTREASRSVLSVERGTRHQPVDGRDARILENHFYNQIVGRERKKSGRRKSQERYPGLLQDNYVLVSEVIKNTKNKTIKKYFLSIKGCFFILGYDWTDDELQKIITIAAKYHLFFAYLDMIIQNTSIKFVKNIFIEPIKDLIKNNRVILDNDFWLSFNMIADLIGKKFYDFYIDGMRKKHKSKLSYVEALLQNTWYNELKIQQWKKNLLKIYSKSLDNYLDDDQDEKISFTIMRSIHMAYYHANGIIPPLKYEQSIRLFD